MSTQISGSGVVTPTLDLTTPLAQADGGTGQSTALAAVVALLGTQSISANGYVHIGDLLIQWGTLTTTAGADTTVTYPIAFPNAIYSVTGTAQSSGTTQAIFQLQGAPTITNFPCTVNNAGSRVALPVFWIAIGK